MLPNSLRLHHHGMDTWFSPWRAQIRGINQTFDSLFSLWQGQIRGVNIIAIWDWWEVPKHSSSDDFPQHSAAWQRATWLSWQWLGNLAGAVHYQTCLIVLSILRNLSIAVGLGAEPLKWIWSHIQNFSTEKIILHLTVGNLLLVLSQSRLVNIITLKI